MLPAAHHRCNISSKGAVLPGRNDAEMGPVNSLHASGYYSVYNERFDLILDLKGNCQTPIVMITTVEKKNQCQRELAIQ